MQQLDRRAHRGPLPLTPRTLTLIEDMRIEWRELDRRIWALEDEFADKAKTDQIARRLSSIPGIGPLNATALIARPSETDERSDEPVTWQLGLAWLGAATRHDRQAQAARHQ